MESCAHFGVGWEAPYAQDSTRPFEARIPWVRLTAVSRDQVGVQLAYELRELLRASHGMKYVDDRSDEPADLYVFLVTADANKDDRLEGVQTVYSLVITRDAPLVDGLYFEEHFVGVCGQQRVKSCAGSQIGNIDEAAASSMSQFASDLSSLTEAVHLIDRWNDLPDVSPSFEGEAPKKRGSRLRDLATDSLDNGLVTALAIGARLASWRSREFSAADSRGRRWNEKRISFLTAGRRARRRGAVRSPVRSAPGILHLGPPAHARECRTS